MHTNRSTKGRTTNLSSLLWGSIVFAKGLHCKSCIALCMEDLLFFSRDGVVVGKA